MQIERMKVQIWWALLLLIAIGALLTLAGISRVITYMSTGADPATALTLVPVAPPDLEKRLQWLPDQPLSAQQRVMEANTRAQITASYLRAWAQWNISYEVGQPYGLRTYFSGPALAGVTRSVTETVAADWQLRQSNLHHELELYFYADDGSVVAFSDRNLQLVQHFRHQATDDSFVVETSHVYDVLMLLEDGDWRVYQWRRQGDAAPTATESWIDPAAPPPAPRPKPPQMAVIHERQLWVNGAPFSVAGINYYPQASPWTKFWPQYDPAQTATDLALVRALGFNTVRIFLSYADFGGPQVAPLMRTRLSDFLQQARRANLKVIVTLFDHHTDHHPATWAADARHLATLLPYFVNDPTILAWDIKNEPDRDYGYNTQAVVDSWLRFVARHVRWHDPNHLITIGWSNPEAAGALSETVDFVTYHYFDEPEAYTPRVRALQQAVGDKPILLEEFTFSTWNSPFFPGHTDAEQAHYYAALLRQHQALDSLGYLTWTLYDFDEVPLAEFRYPWQRGAQAHMGVIRRNGTAKPAAALVTPGATLNPPPNPFWHAFVKPFWLLLYSFFLLMGALVVWQRRRNLRL